MVVNSVNTTLNWDIHSLYKAIATAVCPEVAEEYRQEHLASVSEKNVVVTSAGNLKCKKHCHVFVPPQQQNDNSVSTEVNILLSV